MKKLCTALTLACLSTLAYAHDKCQTNAILPNHSPTQFEFVNGGSEVLDRTTGLIWQRCSLGQTWNGTTCIGTPHTYTWAQALNASQTVGNGYRLPTIGELVSLSNYQCYEPAINLSFFPATPDGDYWSSSPYVGSTNHAWGVNFYIGDTHYFTKDSKRHVRAVRQP